MLFSIIIPEYNGAKYIPQVLDSIYSQGLEYDEFEVIVVDDCSPTDEGIRSIISYRDQHQIPTSNLHYLIHETNKKQGGARNSALDKAHGKYLIYLDCDDYFMPNSLSEIKSYIEKAGNIDVIQIDYNKNIDGVIVAPTHYSHNVPGIMTPEIYFKTNEVAWTPWCYITRRDYVKGIGLRFVENKLFEDTDHSLELVARAKSVAYLPVQLISYSQTGTSTVNIGKNTSKLIELFSQVDRIGKLVERLFKISPNVASLVKSHYDFAYNSYIRRSLWRLPVSDMRDALIKNPYRFHSSHFLLNLSRKHPKQMFIMAVLAKPVLSSLYKLKPTLKRILK